MTSPSPLERLAGPGNILAKEAPDAKEFAGLLRSGLARLKDAENDGSWRAVKALWQERLMVHVLRRTVSTGGIGFATREELAGYVMRAGFVVDDITSYARGYTAPHVLLTAHLPDAR